VLQNWWRQIEPGVVFVSTPRSGGWKHAPRFDACGDVMTDAASFRFVVEVKRRQAWSETRFERGASSPVWAWWGQACRDAERQGGEPMLWFRKDGRRVWRVLLRRRYVEAVGGLEPDFPIPSPTVRLSPDPARDQKAGRDTWRPVGFWAETLVAFSPEMFACSF